jgi:hypothetical protein
MSDGDKCVKPNAYIEALAWCKRYNIGAKTCKTSYEANKQEAQDKACERYTERFAYSSPPKTKTPSPVKSKTPSPVKSKSPGPIVDIKPDVPKNKTSKKPKQDPIGFKTFAMDNYVRYNELSDNRDKSHEELIEILRTDWKKIKKVNKTKYIEVESNVEKSTFEKKWKRFLDSQIRIAKDKLEFKEMKRREKEEYDRQVQDMNRRY